MIRFRSPSLVHDHPFQLGISVALILFGLRALLSSSAAPGSVADLPNAILYAYCAISLLGGGLSLTGLILRHKLWTTGVERAGMYMSAAAFLSYAVGILGDYSSPRSTLLILALLSLSFSCVARARALAKDDKTKIAALRQAKQDRDGSS